MFPPRNILISKSHTTLKYTQCCINSGLCESVGRQNRSSKPGHAETKRDFGDAHI